MTSIPKPLHHTSQLPWELNSSVEPAERDLPGVTIVMPVFNAGKFIEKTIRSLLLNDLTGCELILMDGGSTDDSMRIVEHYRKLFSKVVSEKDKGQSDAINKGFALSTQPILYWLNGDDIILPNALTNIRRAFKQNPNTQVLVGNAYMTEIDFRPIHHFKFSEEKLRFAHLLDYAKNHLVQPSVFFTKKAWDTCGPVKMDLHYAMDADLFIGMAKTFQMAAIDIDIAYSVYHEECKTRGCRAESIVELALVQASHGGMTESKNTLGVLIAEFNQLKERIAQTPSTSDDVAILKERIKAMENDMNKNIELAMLADFLEV